MSCYIAISSVECVVDFMFGWFQREKYFILPGKDILESYHVFLGKKGFGVLAVPILIP